MKKSVKMIRMQVNWSFTGVKTSGVIVYPSVGEVEEVRLYAEGSSDNYDIDIEPFQFDIPLK